MMFCICFFRQKKPSGIVKRDFAGKWGTTKPGSSFFLSIFSQQVLEPNKQNALQKHLVLTCTCWLSPHGPLGPLKDC